jgi:RHS repeat-associated protein
VNVTKGTAPSLSVSYNAATNRRSSDTADANGNIFQNGIAAYDIDNRIALVNTSGGGTARYSYGPGNKRVWRGAWDSGGTKVTDEITFYSASGAKLDAYNVIYANGNTYLTSTGRYEYFGGKLLKNATGYVGQDRLGSIGKFFPYGQERTATSNGTEKFATYTRDAETGLDYAQNRYHSSGDGRFLSPDPHQPSAGLEDPGSWNRYAYVGGDPINFLDPLGLQECPAGTTFCVDSKPACKWWQIWCYGGGEPPVRTGGGGGGGRSRDWEPPKLEMPQDGEYDTERGGVPSCPTGFQWSGTACVVSSPKFVLDCFNATVRDNVVNLGADMIGFLPLGPIVQMLVGFVDFAESAAGPNPDPAGAVASVIGAQLGLLEATAIAGGLIARSVPGIAFAFNIVTTLEDIRETIAQFDSCVRRGIP